MIRLLIVSHAEPTEPRAINIVYKERRMEFFYITAQECEYKAAEMLRYGDDTKNRNEDKGKHGKKEGEKGEGKGEEDKEKAHKDGTTFTGNHFSFDLLFDIQRPK